MNGIQYVALLHLRMIFRSGHRFPADILSLKIKQISDVNEEASQRQDPLPNTEHT
jgi:hypothetical protein